MTAEEILEKHCGKINVPFDNYAIEYHTAIIDAMESYAQQQCQKRDELIKVWELSYDFILKYIDYEKMSHNGSLAVWHNEYLQKISDLKSEIQ